MGIGGHMLGDRKLRRLREVSGLDLDRAFRRGPQCEGRVVADGACTHYAIDWDSGESTPLTGVIHWTSCPHVSAVLDRIRTKGQE